MAARGDAELDVRKDPLMFNIPTRKVNRTLEPEWHQARPYDAAVHTPAWIASKLVGPGAPADSVVFLRPAPGCDVYAVPAYATGRRLNWLATVMFRRAGGEERAAAPYREPDDEDEDMSDRMYEYMVSGVALHGNVLLLPPTFDAAPVRIIANGDWTEWRPQPDLDNDPEHISGLETIRTLVCMAPCYWVERAFRRARKLARRAYHRLRGDGEHRHGD
jgi:hypothetical protein